MGWQLVLFDWDSSRIYRQTGTEDLLLVLCSVEAVQRRLASVIGTPVSEQILIVNGTPLDPRQSLSIYKLPVCTASAYWLCVSQHIPTSPSYCKQYPPVFEGWLIMQHV